MLLAALAISAAFAAQDTSRVIEVPDSGRIVRVGAFRPRQYLGDEDFPGGVTPNRRNAIRAFGRPDGKNPQGCPNKWKRLGVRMVVADFGGGPACAATTPVQQLVITGRAWRTERGLKIGDSLDRVRELYPELRRFSELYDLDAPAYRYTLGPRLRAVGRRRAAEPARPPLGRDPRPQGPLVHGLALRRGRLTTKPAGRRASRSTATGIRTPVSAVRGRRPSPLDDSGREPRRPE